MEVRVKVYEVQFEEEEPRCCFLVLADGRIAVVV